MTLHLAVFALVSLSAFAPAPPVDAVTGTIQSIAGNEIQLRAGARLVTLYADNETEVCRGKLYHDLSHLMAGDEIRVSYRGKPPGKLMAARISAMVTFSGALKSSSATGLEILENPATNAIRLVHLSAETVFGVGKTQLIVGRELKVVGWDLGNGAIDALRIAVYNTDLPARLPDRERR